jgi:pyruvate carboxylase
VKDKPVINGRPGASLDPVNTNDLHTALKEKFEGTKISHRDLLSAAMYPKVFDEYMAFKGEFSRYVEHLPTRAFLAPLDVDEDVDVELSKGNVVNIKYKAKGELQPSGMREVFFEANGIPRVVEVRDTNKSQQGQAPKIQARDKADPSDIGSVASPMSGEVIDVKAKPGSSVQAGETLVVLSAMKMETSVAAPCSGTVRHVAVIKGDQLDAGDLLVSINAGDDPLASGEAQEETSELASK